MKSVLTRPPARAALDPTPLGETQVAALADDLAPKISPVDPDRRRWSGPRRLRAIRWWP